MPQPPLIVSRSRKESYAASHPERSFTPAALWLRNSVPGYACSLFFRTQANATLANGFLSAVTARADWGGTRKESAARHTRGQFILVHGNAGIYVIIPR